MIKFPLSDTSAEGNRKRARVTLLQRNRGIVEFPFYLVEDFKRTKDGRKVSMVEFPLGDTYIGLTRPS